MLRVPDPILTSLHIRHVPVHTARLEILRDVFAQTLGIPKGQLGDGLDADPAKGVRVEPTEVSAARQIRVRDEPAEVSLAEAELAPQLVSLLGSLAASQHVVVRAELVLTKKLDLTLWQCE